MRFFLFFFYKLARTQTAQQIFYFITVYLYNIPYSFIAERPAAEIRVIFGVQNENQPPFLFTANFYS